VLAFILSPPPLLDAQQPERPKIHKGVLEEVQQKGVVRVMVELNVPWEAEGRLSVTDKEAQRNSMIRSQKLLLNELSGSKFKVIRQSKSIPAIDLEVDAKALSILERSSHIKSVRGKEQWKPFVNESAPLIGGNTAQGSVDMMPVGTRLSI